MEVTTEKDVYAKYGKLICMVQNIEKGMLILSIARKNITRDRFKEIYYERSFQTFGMLKTSLKEEKIFDDKEWTLVEEFGDDRNNLVHHFWWERAVESSILSNMGSILKELELIELKLSLIYSIVGNKLDDSVKDKSILESNRNKLLEKGKTLPIEEFRILKREETVVDIVKYRLNTQRPLVIFQLEDNTLWTLCESGLTQFKEQFDFLETERYAELEGIFPIKQFNPRPKNKVDDWYYDLALKTKSLQIEVRPTRKEGAKVISYSVRIGANKVVPNKAK